MHPGKTIAAATAGLMALLALTVGVSYLPLGALGVALALGIALLKATIVAIWFMQLRRAHPTVRLFAWASLGWVIMLLGGVLSDYLSRGL